MTGPTTPTPRPAWRSALAVGLLLAVRVACDLTRLAARPDRYWDREEAYNAAVGWYLAHARLYDQLLALQYKTFCGGCSVVSALSAPALALGGDHLLIAKLVPLAWSVATVLAGAWAVRRHAGDAAGWAFLVLFCVPPPGLADLGLMAWGNHAEGLLFVFLALGLWEGGGGLGLGLALGLGVWFCRTTLVAPVVLGAAALRAGPRRRDLLVGAALGLAPMALPAAGGDSGYYRFGPADNLLPHGLAEGWARVAPMLSPEQLGWRLTTGVQGMERVAPLWLVAVGAALVLLVGARRPRALVVPAMALVYLLAFGASGFPVTRFRPQGTLLAIRYSAPWMALLLASAAVGCGLWIARGGARRWVGVGALLAVLAPSAVAQASAVRAAWTSGPARSVPGALPDVWETPVVYHPGFAWIATWRLDDARLAQAHAADPRTEGTLRRMGGYREAEAVHAAGGALGGEAWRAALDRQADAGAVAGLTQALTDGDRGWAALPAAGAALVGAPAVVVDAAGQGVSANLRVAAASAAPGGPADDAAWRARHVLDAARAGLAAGAPCLGCRAAGAAAWDACRMRSASIDGTSRGARRAGGDGVRAMAACVEQAVAAAGADGAAVAEGAGASCPQPGRSRAGCRAVAGALRGAVAASFQTGLADPTAGADRPFLLLDAAAAAESAPDALRSAGEPRR